MADAVSQSDGSKFSYNYAYKAGAITAFVLLLALFPEYIQFQGTSWEVVQLIFVGIAVSYGLFSKKNDDDETDKLDNAQTYVSKLLQVSSVFESENQAVIVDEDDDDENKNNSNIVEHQRTWNSQYHRGEALKLVADKQGPNPNPNPNPIRGRGEKPLLLPVRSLKQLRVDDNDDDDNRSKRFSNSQSFNGSSSSSSKMDANLGEKVEDNIVLPSPIPWRSRSGCLHTNNPPDFTTSQSQSPSFKKSPVKTSEDLMEKKMNYQKFPPPPPPPPPAPPPRRVLSEAELPRRANNDDHVGKSVRTIRGKPMNETSDDDSEELESEEDDDDYRGSHGGSGSGSSSSSSPSSNNNDDDAGRDVDKKADEFIAKFREQIRLQRIESIRKTTTHRAAQNTSTSTSTRG